MTFQAAALAAFAAASPAAHAAASASSLASGAVDFLDAGGTVLASASLGTPTSSGAVMTGGGFPKSATVASNGTIASARLRTSGAADWKSGITVGVSGSGAQAILSALSVTAGQTLTINSLTLTHTATAAAA